MNAAGNAITAEDFDAGASSVGSTPPFLGLWSLEFNTGGSGSFCNGTTEPGDNQVYQDCVIVDSSTTYTAVEAGATPLPATLPLFAGGLGAMGLLGWRRKRKNAAAIAAA